jgi:hypothetical protein
MSYYKPAKFFAARFRELVVPDSQVMIRSQAVLIFNYQRTFVEATGVSAVRRCAVVLVCCPLICGWLSTTG